MYDCVCAVWAPCVATCNLGEEGIWFNLDVDDLTYRCFTLLLAAAAWCQCADAISSSIPLMSALMYVTT